MKFEEKIARLKQIESVAALAGINGVISDDGEMFVLGFDQGEGRHQRVFIRPSGTTPDGKAIATITSPAKIQAKGGWLNDFSREDALELLKMNENMFFARYGIQDPGKESKEMMIVASSDVILESLDAEELRAHLFFVASAADNYEKKLKVDKF